MESLLGKLYSRIAGSPEDIASDGLTYILEKSAGAKQVMNRLYEVHCELQLDIQKYITQSIGKNLERPDITGLDANGDKAVIIEAKFWAAFTDNQPVTYLNSLIDNSVLIIVCPTLRKKTIYAELINRLINGGVAIIKEESDNYRVVLEKGKNVLVKSWNEILDALRMQLVQDNESTLISDIDQIIGLCNTIDRDSFLPLRSEDLSPGLAIRISSYYDVCDKVIQELKYRKLANTQNLKATNQRYGYTRYFYTTLLAGSLELNLNYWSKNADTPFWLAFWERTPKGWKTTKLLKDACKKAEISLKHMTAQLGHSGVSFALFPLLDQTEDIVVKDLADQVEKLINTIESGINDSFTQATV